MAERIYTEEEIQDLTDRVFLLKEQLEAGKIFFAEHLVADFQRSLGAIRLRTDGLVAPETVDGRIRTATLAIRAMKQREEAKNAVSLAQIQEIYFNFLFRQMGWLYDEMLKTQVNPAIVATAMAKDREFVNHTVSIFPDMAAEVDDFWKAVGDAGAFHLQDSKQLKATFAGDLFPAYWENPVSTAGLYIDTLVLPCPITRIAPLVNVLPDHVVIKLFVKHVLTAMSYRDVATADVAPPIVLVLPNTEDLGTDSRQHFIERSGPATLKHAEYLFGRSFESVEHLKDFCDHLISVEQVMAELKGADRLLFDTVWDRDPHAQLVHAMTAGLPAIPGTDQGTAGHQILSACIGRMSQAIAAQDNALHFGATPFINAETSWLYYTWMLEYEAAAQPQNDHLGRGMHVVRALVAESQNNLVWLGKVPPETVLEIRRRGLADEVRALLGQGVSELIGINPSNYFRTADEVVENLDRAFREHQRMLFESKQKKLRLYGLDIGSFVATGTIAVTAALTGNPMLGAVSGLLGIAGLPNLKDIKTKFAAIAEEESARKASPTGLLFRHVQNRR
jgi:hypothetical protein